MDEVQWFIRTSISNTAWLARGEKNSVSSWRWKAKKFQISAEKYVTTFHQKPIYRGKFLLKRRKNDFEKAKIVYSSRTNYGFCHVYNSTTLFLARFRRKSFFDFGLTLKNRHRVFQDFKIVRPTISKKFWLEIFVLFSTILPFNRQVWEIKKETHMLNQINY